MDLFKIEKCFDRFDGIFVGGTPEWKWKRYDLWIEYAWMCGLPCHIGQVGTFRKIKACSKAGADSIDTSTITQANNNRRFGQYSGFRMLETIDIQTCLNTSY